MEQVHGVDHLLRRDHNVDHLEVVLEPVADELAAGVDEVAQLLVRGLERGQVLRAVVGVQVPC